MGRSMVAHFPTYYLSKLCMIREESCALPSVSVQALEGLVWTYETRRTLWLWLWVDDATRRGGGAVGEDEILVDVLFCEGGVSGMELGLVVGGCESIERG